MTPSPHAEKIWAMKRHFNLFEDQEKTRNDSVISLNEAHITLRRRFYLKDPAMESSFIKELEKISFPPILIKAETIDVFESETKGNVLIALVTPSQLLKNLQTEIVSTLAPFIDEKLSKDAFGFTPHISLVYEVPDAQIKEAKIYVENNILPISYEMKDFHLLRNIEGVSKERVILSIIQV